MLRPRSLGLLLLLVTLLVYLPTTFDHFINYDDPDYVVENPFVNEGLTWLGFKWAFVAAHSDNWHPLTWLSHMLDCNLFHLNPGGPHLVNSLFHAVNTALLFALILAFTSFGRETDPIQKSDQLWPAAFVAALFAWHPLHVESVAWIAERKDVLSTLFSLLSLLSYIRYARARSQFICTEPGSTVAPMIRDYTLALICFALALLAKPMPVTLPLVMLLLDFWPLKRSPARPEWLWSAGLLLLEKFPFFVLSGVICLITVLCQNHAESSFSNIPLVIRLENVVTAYAGYLGKMIWPVNLAIFYPFEPHISRTLFVESALFLAGISAIAWLERKAHPYLLVGWLWFLVTLVPVIGLVQVGAQSMADRYSYFPSIGIFLVVSFSLRDLGDHFRFLRKWLVAAAISALVVFVALTERQLSYWHDSVTIFSHAIEVEDSGLARVSLGAALRDENQMTGAMTQFIIAWRLNPDSMLANINVAGMLASEGKPALAAVYYERVVRNNNWLPLADENYGRVLATLKRYDEAMKQFSAAALIDPLDPLPHFLMGQLLLHEGQDQNAVKELSKALDLEPQNLQVTILLASVLASSENAQVRNGAEAKVLASRAVDLTHSQEAAALDVLAMSCAEMGRFADAVLIQQKAMEVAQTTGQTDSLDLLQKRLQLYEKHQPWREEFNMN